MTRKQDRNETPAEQQPGGDPRPDLTDPATAKFRRADSDEALTTTREGHQPDPNGANRRKRAKGIPRHEEASDETPS